MATSKELFTNLADELRDLTNTTDKMGLSKMAEHVADANDEIADQDALVEQLIQAMSGKSVPGGGSGGIEYEVITIPAGATSATYTLPRVTNAYGCGGRHHETDGLESMIIGIFDTLACIVYPVDDSCVLFDTVYVRYEKGHINFDYGVAVHPLELILINDPSKDMLRSCTV